MWVDRKLVRPTLWLSTLTSPVTLTLDFQGQIFKKLYLRNGSVSWYGMRGTWVYRMLNPLCNLELWSWPWTSKVELWSSRISRIERPIDMKQKGWVGSWTHCDLDLLTLPMTLDWIFRVKFWNSHISRMEGSIDMEQKVCKSGMMLDLLRNLGLAIWACMWATAHTRYIGQVMGWYKTVEVSNLWVH